MSAANYQDGEVFLPPIKEFKPLEGIVVKLRKKTANTAPVVMQPRLYGAVTYGGKSVTVGWLSLWMRGGEMNAPNACIERGRTVPYGGFKAAEMALCDGNYGLDLPSAGEWFLVVEEPGVAPTVVGPLKVEGKEQRHLDIACTEGGTLAGLVRQVPKGLEGHLWVVAFDDRIMRCETRVAADGSFRLEHVPPGRYGLKVGHDAYHDSEVPEIQFSRPLPKEIWTARATPWNRATGVTVKPGQTAGGIELELPGS